MLPEVAATEESMWRRTCLFRQGRNKSTGSCGHATRWKTTRQLRVAGGRLAPSQM